MNLGFPRLDPPTLLFSVAILAAMLGTVAFTMARGNIGSQSALRYWGKSMACGAGTFFLWTFTGYWPFIATFLIANLFAISAVPLGTIAYSKLFQVEPPKQVFQATVLFGLAGVLGTYFFDTSRGIAIFTMNASLAVQLAVMGHLVFRHRGEHTLGISVLATLVIAFLALTHSARAVTAIIGNTSAVIPTGNSITLIFYYLTFVAYISSTSIALFAINNEKNRRETVERLRRDGLTGLYTRTAFVEMEQEIENAGRIDGYALMMIDIDHFKSINDRFGHGGGDVVLAHVGRLLTNAFRLSDIVVRYGGEEFCVVLRACLETDAEKYASRLVKDANAQTVRLPDGKTARFTLSVGYASALPASSNNTLPESLQSVINRADAALYKAKEAGRNQAVSAAPLELLVAV
ncbi:GGDEF domain-containing protein [Rhodoferax saidenbachensis]|uniref:diguanylate cyclase n=1 Tax=Rhodoferax saidenbachensis TaxID=1484693 RepID=A0ABU1ZRE4_9BURK|nr:GGDEF domain-containing protein [Rhodoferax saidenbachensis]MDR7307953.1 diguanylate cyclase (GGDEF)-like protein [Rhodoferax saidenbachensis]